MSIRLGYIGVADTMEEVLSVILTFPELRCIALVHSRFEDIAPLLVKHAAEVDAWLFSGPLPYRIAVESGASTKPMFAIPYSGSSLYRTLCRIFYDKKIPLHELSFDILCSSELEQVARELGMEERPLHLIEYEGSDDLLVDYHAQLWKDGRTQAAVTCVWLVQQKLEALGIPVFRVTPTEAAVEGVLQTVLRSHELQRLKEAQVKPQEKRAPTLGAARANDIAFISRRERLSIRNTCFTVG